MAAFILHYVCKKTQKLPRIYVTWTHLDFCWWYHT